MMVNYKCRGCGKMFKVKRWINYIEGIVLIYPFIQDRFGKGGYYCDKCFDNLNKIKEKPEKEIELEKELNKLVRLGMLKKSKKGWQDSDLCKKIDLSKPREAFLIGIAQAQKECENGKYAVRLVELGKRTAQTEEIEFLKTLSQEITLVGKAENIVLKRLAKLQEQKDDGGKE